MTALFTTCRLAQTSLECATVVSQSKPNLIDIDVKTWSSEPSITKPQNITKPQKSRYPAKPQLRKRHWFLGGLLVIFCSWASFSSTASISQTPRQVSKVEFDKLDVEKEISTIEEDDFDSSYEHINSSADHSNDDANNNHVSNSIDDIEQTNKNPTVNSTTIVNTIVETIPPSPNIEVIEYKIKRGDSLGSIFGKMGLSRVLPHNIAQDDIGKQLKSISVGRTLYLELTDSLPTKITYALSPLRNLEIEINPDDNSVIAVEVDVEHDVVTHTASASIEDSLFLAASRAGVNDNMIMDMAAIFGWDVDFSRDIRKGDHFTLVYEQHKKGEEILSIGNILSARFVNAGETFSAIRFTDSNGDTGYYSPDGKSMKGTFLKSPMKFSRVSSGFTKRRFHPVLKKWRAHKGVDYAAATGTPIRTTANGKVTFVGKKGGYGRTVIINHGGRYSTLYAHMSRYKKGVRSGSYVKQGQTIGYVGKSGLATGPHLHYEFRVNGVHQNSLTYKTPKSTPVLKKDMPRFKAFAANQLAMLEPTTESKPVAGSELDNTSTTASTKDLQDNTDKNKKKEDAVLTR